MNNFESVLVLVPHTDDGEIGRGGTIVRFIKGKQVYYVAFSIRCIVPRVAFETFISV